MSDKRKSIRPGITRITSEKTGTITWQCRWSWTSPLGERLFGSKIFKDLFQAETHLLETQLSLRRGDLGPTDTTTLDQYAVRWLDRMAHSWAPSTERSRRQGWNDWIRPRLGRVRVVDIRRHHCQQLVDDMNAAGRRPSTVRFHTACLSGILEGAMVDGLISRNPARKLILPAVTRHDIDFWSVEQARQFLVETRESPYHTLWVVMMTTGIRVGEALALSWRDVDLEARTLSVRSTVATMLNGREEVVNTTKTRRSRTVPLMPYAVACLRDLKRQQQSADATVRDIRSFVFARKTGRRYSRSTIPLAMRRDASRAGLPLPEVRVCNPLRHVAATLLAVQGVHPSTVQQILGHTTATMTLARYTHMDTSFTRQAVDDLAAALMIQDATTSLPDTVESGGSV